MAVLTPIPTSVLPGIPSATITFSPSDLISVYGITGYWGSSSNWSKVTFVYQDATGVQHTFLDFVMGTNTDVFSVASTALENTWQCTDILIFDKVQASPYHILRAAGLSAYDILVGSIVLVTPFLEFNPALANAGTAPFSDNTTLNGTTWKELRQGGTNYSMDMVDSIGSVAKWKGTTAPYYADFYPSLNSGVTPLGGSKLVTPTSAPTNYQALMFWYKAPPTAGNMGGVSLMSSGTYYENAILDQGAGTLAVYNNIGGGAVTYTIPSYGSSTVGVWRLFTLVRTYNGGTSTAEAWIDTTRVCNASAANNSYAPKALTFFFGFTDAYPGHGPGGQIGQVWYFNDSAGQIGSTQITDYYNSTKATYGY